MISEHLNVLIVDDCADQCVLLAEVLRLHFGSGVKVESAHSGRECLAKDWSQFDVILLDFHLGDTTGLELLDKILGTVDRPVLFITGHSDVTAAAKAIQRGAEDYIVKAGDYLFTVPIMVEKAIRQHAIKLENRRLQTRLREMLAQLETKNRQLQESLEEVRALATTDHLTGLANRRQFGEELERGFDQACRYGFDLTCCMLDLDYYKQLNDALGHQAGDQMLVLMADIIRESLRSSDIAARYGGDEFVLLLPHASLELAHGVCQRIRAVLMERTIGRRPMTLSVGVASLEANHPRSADELVMMADRAPYHAKGRGKDRVEIYAAVEG